MNEFFCYPYRITTGITCNELFVSRVQNILFNYKRNLCYQIKWLLTEFFVMYENKEKDRILTKKIKTKTYKHFVSKGKDSVGELNHENQLK